MKKVFIFFGSAVLAGLIGFFIQRSMPAPQHQPQQSVEQAGPVVNPNRDPFPKETGNPTEENPDGQPIDVPYIPPAPAQNQQADASQNGQADTSQQAQAGQQENQQQAQGSGNQPAPATSNTIIEQVEEDSSLPENL